MPAFGERDVAEELVVGVDAAARVAGGGPERAVLAVGVIDDDGGQSQIACAVVRRKGVQAKRGVRVEANVLRQELLQEAVVAAAYLDDQVGLWNRCIGQRNDVDVRGGYNRFL